MSILSILIVAQLVSCHSEEKRKFAPEEEAIYSLGQMQARRLAYLDLSPNEQEIFILGYRGAAFNSSATATTISEGEIQRFIEQRIRNVAEKEKKKGAAYMRAFVAKGGKQSPSGLGYEIIGLGNSKRAKVGDTIEVHYHGTFIDGTIFDSSLDRGKTIEIPLRSVIVGWQEGLQLIGEGGEIRLVVPSDLGYGEQGSQPQIRGGQTLVFYIKLFKIPGG
ncbi:MAG: FKBP-type peptidyl-prolyl cis-trans isomerase [Deltaproteobacteria bacterium]|nr:FKBP-type peptidyl-prolyl cis-trans isomerase [Deltaproteobacteria bacterium]